MNNTSSPIIANWQQISQTGVIPNGMSLLREDREFHIVKERTISEEKTGKKKMRLTGIVQKADVYNENGRRYDSGVLTEAVDVIQESINNRKVMGEFDHPCFTSSDFRVLTIDGWKEFKDIKEGDRVYSLKDGVMVESRVNKIIDEQYTGSVYNFKGNNIDTTVTSPHRMLLIKRPDRGYDEIYATAKEIYDDRKAFSHSSIPRTGGWEGTNPEFITIPGIAKSDLSVSEKHYKHDITEDLKIDTKIFAAFMGIYLAEGNLNGHSVIISQFKEHTKAAIKELLSQFPFEWNEDKRGFNVSDIRLAKYLEPLGDCYNKYIPHEIKQLSIPYLEELIDWFSLGDGRNVDYESDNGCVYNRRAIFSVSKKLIQDLHECLIKSGGCGNLQKIIATKDYMFAGHLIEAKNKSPLWQLHIATTKNIHLDPRFLEITEEHYDGNIYCLSVDHGNFYVEQNNKSYWTGNCDAKIHMDRVSHLMTKVWMENNNVLGELEVIEDMPCGQMLAALVRAGVTVGISSRGVGDMRPVVSEGTEAYEVLPGYRFVTWDVVAEPSVKEAELSVMESKQRKIFLQKRNVEQELIKEIINRFRG